jgi:hypothetical protein
MHFNIVWPQQPSTEMALNISEKFGFDDQIYKKGK